MSYKTKMTGERDWIIMVILFGVITILVTFLSGHPADNQLVETKTSVKEITQEIPANLSPR
jgi:hypothetical protein